MTLRTISASGLVLAGLVSAHAQDARDPSPYGPGSAALSNYIKSDQRRAAMSQTLRQMVPLVAGDCKEIKPGPKTRTQVLKPLSFNTTGQPVSGVFKEIVPVDMCGETVEMNLLAVPQPDGTVKRMNLLPGHSIADPQLQKDALASAYLAASKGAECRPYAVRNTRAEAREADGHWTERWDLLVCGKRVPVTMTFTPTTDGGTNFKAAAADR
jgi:hypothetical protein